MDGKSSKTRKIHTTGKKQDGKERDGVQGRNMEHHKMQGDKNSPQWRIRVILNFYTKKNSQNGFHIKILGKVWPDGVAFELGSSLTGLRNGNKVPIKQKFYTFPTPASTRLNTIHHHQWCVKYAPIRWAFGINVQYIVLEKGRMRDGVTWWTWVEKVKNAEVKDQGGWGKGTERGREKVDQVSVCYLGQDGRKHKIFRSVRKQPCKTK